MKKFLSFAVIVALTLVQLHSKSPQVWAFGDTGSTISAGSGYSMVIKDDYSLWGWGINNRGQLGIGTIDNESHLTPVKIMDSVVSVSVGANHTMAIKKDGSLWAWGADVGRLFGGATLGLSPDNPTPIKIMESVASVSAGNGYTMAIKTDGSLWAWGLGSFGQLGAGKIHLSGPVKIMDSVASVSACSRHTMAIKTDGSLWGWGQNESGQLGDGTTEERLIPIKIMDSVKSVSINGTGTMAIKTDGTLWAWGHNSFGQLGIGYADSEPHPTPVKIMDSVTSVSALGTMAIKKDGSLWAWGSNSNDKLGIGSANLEPHPIPAKIMDSVASVSASGTMLIKTDGSLWAWEKINTNKLGVGNTDEQYFELVEIMKGINILSNEQSFIQEQPTSALVLMGYPTVSTVLVNGENVVFDAYNIEGNNFFKLRDLAFALNGTDKQFSVRWDEAIDAISLTSNQPYLAVGGEMQGKSEGIKNATPTNSRIFIDGKEVLFIAYNIGGNNYFRLRDIGAAFDLGINWDAERNTIKINSTLPQAMTKNIIKQNPV